MQYKIYKIMKEDSEREFVLDFGGTDKEVYKVMQHVKNLNSCYGVVAKKMNAPWFTLYAITGDQNDKQS